MDIAVEKDGDVTTVHLQGRLDALTSKSIEERLLQLIDGGERKLVLDLSKLDYISSVGLRVLILVAKRLKPLEGRVVVCGLQETIRQVFEIAGFSSIFPIYDDQAQAKGSF